jgi:LAO/AO transport system kinase
MKLLDRFFSGDRSALSRVITLIENDTLRRPALIDALYPHTGRALRIGLTGPPGAGKSSLVDRLIGRFRGEGRSVGVIAVDPSSPFTGGALLGDRVRMQSFWADTGVFIRSMADRGHAGGLSSATPDVITALDAFGKEVILVETVGVGQSTLDIFEMAETTVVVLTPESGDSVQALKAGLMEIADILVVNKDDREGAGAFAADLQMMLEMRFTASEWFPPVVRTSARENSGVDELHQAIQQHRTFLMDSGVMEKRRRRQFRSAIMRLARERFDQRIREIVDLEQTLERLVDEMMRRECAPQDAVDHLLRLAGLTAAMEKSEVKHGQ